MTTFHNSKTFYSPTGVALDDSKPTEAEFEAVTDWVEMTGLLSAPSFGATDQYVSQNLLSQDIESSQKTVATTGEGDIVAEYRAGDANQAQWKTAGETTRNYFIKQELNDAPDPTMTNTINYVVSLIGRQRFTEASAPGDFVNLVQPIKANSDVITVPPTTI